MEQVGIRDLRSRLASLVRRAGRGEQIRITVDGTPVAQLGPLSPVSTGIDLHDLAAAGLIDAPAQQARHSAQSAREMPAPFSVPADVRLDRLMDQIRGS